ncbi:MAG TPA: phosphoglycolate phosphatase [Albidovulum sp.]|uniref:phosphoglycolate phosphatase n=1 Tax=Albidovulum sp. TaxID=1872424 RepID=UPI002BD941F1|nr:phosphoglycolate phosphatase [Albidovulum sp.]
MTSVIFDLDGTLIDSLPDIHAAVNRLLASEGQAPMPRAEVQSYVGDGAPVLIRRVMASRGMEMVRHGELAARMVADYTARSCEETTVYPHVAGTLAALRADGCRLGICTNKPESATRAVLAELGLAGFFEVIVAGDSLPERKPDPAPLLHAARLLGSARAVFVGDSEVDARTAEAAALPFVLFSEGYLRVPRHEISPVAEFSDYRELPALLTVSASAG